MWSRDPACRKAVVLSISLLVFKILAWWFLSQYAHQIMKLSFLRVSLLYWLIIFLSDARAAAKMVTYSSNVVADLIDVYRTCSAVLQIARYLLSLLVCCCCFKIIYSWCFFFNDSSFYFYLICIDISFLLLPFSSFFLHSTLSYSFLFISCLSPPSFFFFHFIFIPLWFLQARSIWLQKVPFHLQHLPCFKIIGRFFYSSTLLFWILTIVLLWLSFNFLNNSLGPSCK